MKGKFKRPIESLIIIIAGLVWLIAGFESGTGAFFLAVIPGSIILALGISFQFIPTSTRLITLSASASGFALLISIPIIFFAKSVIMALIFPIFALTSFFAVGAISIRYQQSIPDVPEPEYTAVMAGKVALDECLFNLAPMVMIRVNDEIINRIGREVDEARDLFHEKGWLEKPNKYFVIPPPLDSPKFQSMEYQDIDFEQMTFESSYMPCPEEPGFERWNGYLANRTAYVRILRHYDEERPWIICIHGAGCGFKHDIRFFRMKWLFNTLGFNVAAPILPFHGPRKLGPVSGKNMLSIDILDTIHSEAQAIWELRCLFGWIKNQGGQPVGVMGFSLGGLNTALFASLQGGLACAIPIVPVCDLLHLMWQFLPPRILQKCVKAGFSKDAFDQISSVISLLHHKPRCSLDQRCIIAGVADRYTHPEMVKDLWDNWEHPKLHWFQGTHFSAFEKQVYFFIKDALCGMGLVHDGVSIG